MTTSSNLQFIREKIFELRSAIMYPMSNELVHLPNNIVTAVRVDDDGQIWFLVRRPVQSVSECEQVFPVMLKFYRKGVSFFLEVSGKATIVTGADPEFPQSSYNTSMGTGGKPLLIKMTMTSIDYIEPVDKRKTRLEHLIESAYKWLLKTTSFQRHPKPILAKRHQSHI